MPAIIGKKCSFTKEDIYDDLEISPGDYIRLSVTDSGCGMTDEVIDRIFEPFFTTKEPGKGTGLGLASIHGFINQSGGYVRVFSEPSQGTSIVLYLPKFSEIHADQVAAHTNRLEQTNNDARVLVVEDNDMVRNMTVKRLRVLGFATDQVQVIGVTIPLISKKTGYSCNLLRKTQYKSVWNRNSPPLTPLSHFLPTSRLKIR